MYLRPLNSGGRFTQPTRFTTKRNCLRRKMSSPMITMDDWPLATTRRESVSLLLFGRSVATFHRGWFLMLCMNHFPFRRNSRDDGSQSIAFAMWPGGNISGVLLHRYNPIFVVLILLSSSLSRTSFSTMKSSLFSALFSPRFIKIWLSTLIAILIVNFTVITYRHDIYTRYRRTKWNPPVEYASRSPSSRKKNLTAIQKINIYSTNLTSTLTDLTNNHRSTKSPLRTKNPPNRLAKLHRSRGRRASDE